MRLTPDDDESIYYEVFLGVHQVLCKMADDEAGEADVVIRDPSGNVLWDGNGQVMTALYKGPVELRKRQG